MKFLSYLPKTTLLYTPVAGDADAFVSVFTGGTDILWSECGELLSLLALEASKFLCLVIMEVHHCPKISYHMDQLGTGHGGGCVVSRCHQDCGG